MRILLIMLVPIGDTLFATPAVRALRVRYPSAHITALVYLTNRGMVANNPDINEFIVWPGMAGVPRLAWKLRTAGFDLAVEFSSYGAGVAKIAGIPRESGMDLPRFWWLLPSAGKEWRKAHAVEHYSDPVRRLGIPINDWRLRMYPTHAEKDRAEGWLHKYGVKQGEMLIGIHPGGEGLWGQKRWGVEGFARVAESLYKEVGARIMLMGGKEDAPLAAEIAARARARIINATGQTTLGETAALAALCDLFIGNDSSPLHIATAMGTKVVGIYGVTDPRSYHPWSPDGREGVDYAIVRATLPCACKFSFIGGITAVQWIRCVFCPALATITPKQVFEASMQLLGGVNRGGM